MLAHQPVQARSQGMRAVGAPLLAVRDRQRPLVRFEGWLDSAPQNWGTTTTVIAALGLRGVVAPLALTGAVNGEVIENYVQQFLVRERRDTDIVILDSLSGHKRPIIRELIERAGAWLLYLPPYSPQLSPIQLAWSKVKACLRSAAARTYQDLITALAGALRTLTAYDALGRFRHCGYLPFE